MFNLFNPANLVRGLTRMNGNGELSFQARAIARWDNEEGGPKASGRHNSRQDEKQRHLAPMSDDEPEARARREASPGSKSGELRALDDLYHQSFWKVQN
jgi:hypothetical protein